MRIGENLVLVSDRNVDWLRDMFGIELTTAPTLLVALPSEAERFAALYAQYAPPARVIATQREKKQCEGCGARFVGINQHKAKCPAYQLTRGGA